jgi:hypothetical protein
MAPSPAQRVQRVQRVQRRRNGSNGSNGSNGRGATCLALRCSCQGISRSGCGSRNRVSRPSIIINNKLPLPLPLFTKSTSAHASMVPVVTRHTEAPLGPPPRRCDPKRTPGVFSASRAACDQAGGNEVVVVCITQQERLDVTTVVGGSTSTPPE